MIRILLATGNPGKAREVREILSGADEREGTRDKTCGPHPSPLAPRPSFEVVTPADLGLDFDVAETGSSFEENARLKALAAWQQSSTNTPRPSPLTPHHSYVLADDSGLEIDALDGRPGVHSARFLGKESSFRQKYLAVLRLMTGIPSTRRSARFRCCAVLLTPSEAVGGFAPASNVGRQSAIRSPQSKIQNPKSKMPPAPSPVAHVFQGICEGQIAREPRGTGGFGYDPVFIPEGYDRTFGELPAEVKNRISHRAQAFRRVREYLERLLIAH